MEFEKTASTLVENWINSQESTGMFHQEAQQALWTAIATALRAAATVPKGMVRVGTEDNDWPAVYVLQEKNIYGKPNTGIILVGVDNDEKAAELAKDLERPGIAARVTKGVTVYSRSAAAQAARERGGEG
jgi:hypothetical protein